MAHVSRHGIFVGRRILQARSLRRDGCFYGRAGRADAVVHGASIGGASMASKLRQFPDLSRRRSVLTLRWAGLDEAYARRIEVMWRELDEARARRIEAPDARRERFFGFCVGLRCPHLDEILGLAQTKIAAAHVGLMVYHASQCH